MNRQALLLIDATATAVEAKHNSLQMALTGALTVAMNARAAQAPANITRLRSDVSTLAYRFYNESADIVAADRDTLIMAAAKEARGLNSLSPEKRQLLAIAATHFQEALSTVMQSDASEVERVYRTFVLQMVGRMSLGEGPAVAGLKARESKVSRLMFKWTNRGGDKWASSYRSRILTRQHLLHTYVETYLASLVDRGIDMALVSHEDPAHEDNGKPFSITGATPDLPVYEDVRDIYFHPNARALVSQA